VRIRLSLGLLSIYVFRGLAKGLEELGKVGAHWLRDGFIGNNRQDDLIIVLLEECLTDGEIISHVLVEVLNKRIAI
jgi:hypothetical protein